jgi:cytochrome P450
MRAGDSKPKPNRSIFEGILAQHPDPENADREAMMQEAGGLVGAGVQTTRWCLSVGLLEIAAEPDIQRKLYEELRDAHPDMAKPLSFVECEKLPYLVGVSSLLHLYCSYDL